jgi:hypothetical protein
LNLALKSETKNSSGSNICVDNTKIRRKNLRMTTRF